MYESLYPILCYTRVLTVEKATNAGPVHIGWLVGDRFVRPQIIPDNTQVRTYQLPWTSRQMTDRK